MCCFIVICHTVAYFRCNVPQAIKRGNFEKRCWTESCKRTVCNRTLCHWAISALWAPNVSRTRDHSNIAIWRYWGLNPGPSACKADALPLCHIPEWLLNHPGLKFNYILHTKSLKPPISLFFANQNIIQNIFIRTYIRYQVLHLQKLTGCGSLEI